MIMNLTDKRFQDATEARKWFELQRWPNGPWCPHCGNAYADRITALHGEAHREGVYQCNEKECRLQFSVTVGTVMERSKIPLNKWLLAMHLMSSSKKGYSAHQLHRTLGITYQSAWFLAHRIREAMKDMGSEAMGGSDKIIEADETYHGKRETPRKRNKYSPPPTRGGKSGGAQKRIIVGLVERGGKVRSFHVQQATAETVRDILVRNVSRKSILHTDESRIYTALGTEFAAHNTINHRDKEYVRGTVHTNTIENVWSVFKRGMKGIYQHCGEAHLHRYLAEFDFRYNNRSALKISDTERTENIAKGVEGKRLTYRSPNKTAYA
jgi:transposase-like protein